MEKIHLNIDEVKVWFTSDTHFGHKNILKFCSETRPYESIKEMNEDIIRIWNEHIQPDDHVFHLGDMFWFGGAHEVAKFCKKLNGHIHLIPGNHDMVGKNHPDYKNQMQADDHDWFKLAENVTVHSDVTSLFLTGRSLPRPTTELVLSHYPLLCYSHSNNKEGCFQLFGHIHSKPGPMLEFGQPVITNGNQLDVGWDRHGRPIDVYDVIVKIQAYRTAYPDLVRMSE